MMILTFMACYLFISFWVFVIGMWDNSMIDYVGIGIASLVLTVWSG